jgi:hypothetical protein
MQKNPESPTFAKFYAALALSRKIPNAGLNNHKQRKQAIHAWAMAIKAALKERERRLT